MKRTEKEFWEHVLSHEGKDCDHFDKRAKCPGKYDNPKILDCTDCPYGDAVSCGVPLNFGISWADWAKMVACAKKFLEEHRNEKRSDKQKKLKERYEMWNNKLLRGGE